MTHTIYGIYKNNDSQYLECVGIKCKWLALSTVYRKIMTHTIHSSQWLALFHHLRTRIGHFSISSILPSVVLFRFVFVLFLTPVEEQKKQHILDVIPATYKAECKEILAIQYSMPTCISPHKLLIKDDSWDFTAQLVSC